MPWYYAVAERDHELQNPTSHEKIRVLGERLRLGPRSLVLDVGCGKGGPAILLAQTYGCRIVAIERAEEFASVAKERVREAGLEPLVQVTVVDALRVELERERYDVAMCLGASFIWDGLRGTLAALSPTAKAGGEVVVGEPFWRQWPLPGGIDDEGYGSLRATAGQFESAGLVLHTLIASSDDDWDRYETLRWRALEEWLAENPDEPDAPEIRRRHDQNRDEYLRFQRELLGWAIFAARKPA